jgi:hypothetical protein
MSVNKVVFRDEKFPTLEPTTITPFSQLPAIEEEEDEPAPPPNPQRGLALRKLEALKAREAKK